MPLNVEVIVRDSDALGRLSEMETVVIPREFGDATTDILQGAVTDLQQYPPETSANQPPPPYYERGRGYVGFGGNVLAGKESENLKDQWSFEVSGGGDSIEGSLINRASYSGYVHGEELQATWHAAIGWPIATDVVRAQIGDQQGTGVARTVSKGLDRLNQAAQRVKDWFNR